MTSRRDLREIWDRASELNACRYLGHGNRNEAYLRKLADNVLDYRLEVEKCDLLVDCGCGICAYDVYWSRRTEFIVAIDISPKMILRARKRLADFHVDNVGLLVADIRKLPIRAGVADAIVSLGVLKHISSNLSPVLGEMSRIGKTLCHSYLNDLPHLLHPDAWLWLVAVFAWRRILGRFTTGTHFFSPWQLARILRQVKVRKVIFLGYGWKFPFSSIFAFLPFLGGKIQRLCCIEPLSPNAPKKSKPIVSLSTMEVTLTF